MTIRDLIFLTIPQFFRNSRVRNEILKLIKSASGSTTVTSSQITDASVIGKEILTATDADAVKADLGITGEEFTQAEKDKLAGIEDSATKNQPDAYLLNRANHTGQQPFSSLSGTATVAQLPAIPITQVTDLTEQLQAKASGANTITGTEGLEGGGTINSNLTIFLSAASKASLALADTAIQQSGLDSATKSKPEITALTPIADPATTTTEQVATLLNSVIAALKA